MTLIEKVTQVRSALRAQKGNYSILTLLIGELETKLKRDGRVINEATDAEVIAAVKKLVKSNNEMILLTTEIQGRKFVDENAVLQQFLPVELTEAEILKLLVDCVFGSVGEAIKALDAKGVPYDKGAAVKLAKSLL